MPRHAAFLRGVNLGKRRRVGGAELRALFEWLGFSDVATFRTSGNVVFTAGREGRAALTDRIERGLADSLGMEVKIFLRTAAEVRAIAAGEPFESAQVAAFGDRHQGPPWTSSAGVKVPCLRQARTEVRRWRSR